VRGDGLAAGEGAAVSKNFRDLPKRLQRQILRKRDLAKNGPVRVLTRDEIAAIYGASKVSKQ
jgi:hypothetical protein